MFIIPALPAFVIVNPEIRSIFGVQRIPIVEPLAENVDCVSGCPLAQQEQSRSRAISAICRGHVGDPRRISNATVADASIRSAKAAT